MIGLILDGKVKGMIDQVAGRLELDRGCVRTSSYLHLVLTSSLPFVFSVDAKSRRLDTSISRAGVRNWAACERPSSPRRPTEGLRATDEQEEVHLV